MKRIAICFRGDFRNWDITKNYLFKFYEEVSTFDSHDTEVHYYFSTWDSVFHTHKKKENSTNTYNYNVPIHLDEILKDFGQSLKLYKVYDNHLRNNRRYQTSLIQYFNIYVVNQLKTRYELKHNFTYDAVINTRVDVIPVDLDGIKKLISLLFQAKEDYYTFINKMGAEPNHSVFNPIWSQDCFFLSDSKTANAIARMFLNVDRNSKNNYMFLDTHHELAKYAKRTSIMFYYPPHFEFYRRVGDLNKVHSLEVNNMNQINLINRLNQIWRE